MSKCINGSHMGNIYISAPRPAQKPIKDQAQHRHQLRLRLGAAITSLLGINYFGTSKISLRLIQTKAPTPKLHRLCSQLFQPAFDSDSNCNFDSDSDSSTDLKTVSVRVEPRPMQIELAHRHRGGIVNRSIAIVLPQPQKDSARSRLRARRHRRPLVYFELSLIWT